MEPSVFYEDKNFLAINKPAGLLVHGTHNLELKTKDPRSKFQVSGRGPTLVDWLLLHYPEVKTVGDKPDERPGIVHRLDKNTSGLMLVARTQEGFDYLKSLFMKRGITKKYLALAWGRMDKKSGVINAPIGLKSGTTKHTVHGGKMIKAAETHWTLKKYVGNFSLLEVEPKTGRTHQIRVHLASIGHPIVGDELYGGKRNKQFLSSKLQVLSPKRLMLHAESLEFPLPDGKRMTLAVEPPEDFLEVLQEIETWNS